ncbi:MAG: hypothetical protein HY402_01935 [Elusimicrobia bacterium]|nr:hypothetical protein [Elusimicrobiota bacterium]
MNAIPAFARKYQTSCTTCHSAPPKLNSFGIAFKLNGYQFPADDEAMVKDKPLDLGVEAHKDMFPKEVWPSQIPGLPPIALRFFGDWTYNRGSRAKNNIDFPNFWRLLAGGSFDDHISALMTICFKSVDDEMREGQATSRNIAFQAQLIFKDLLNGSLGDNRLNLRTGLIDIPNLAFNNFFQHLIVTNYLYGATKIPGSGNDFSFLTPGGSPGAEVYGLSAYNRFYYAVGLNNGDNFGTQDDNSDKDNYVVTRLKIGGIPYGGPGVTAGGLQGGSNDAPSFWKDNSIQIGGLWYRGSAVTTGGAEDNFRRGGVDMRFLHNQERGIPSGSFDLVGGLLWGKNKNPWGTASSSQANFSSWYVEGNYFLFPWLIPGFRYEEVNITETPAALVAPGIPASADTWRYVPGVTFRLRHNIKLNLEGEIYTKFNGATDNTILSNSHRALTRLDVAF